MICQNKNNLLEIYNSLNGTEYENVDDLEITTMKEEDAPSGVFMRYRNDASFVFNFQLNIYEHQSTVNPNMPLRNLLYVAEQYEKLTTTKDLYMENLVKIHAPRFVLFYNGVKATDDDTILKLSDQFEQPMEHPELELTVRALNVNAGHNRELMEKCRCLDEYSRFVARMREALKGKKTRDEKHMAASRIVDQCIQDGILVDILQENRKAVIETSVWEYNEEAHYAALVESGYDNGYAKGRDDGLAAGELKAQADLVLRKVRKGKNLTQIAEDLDLDENALEPVYRAVVAAGPEYDIGQIMAALTASR